MGSRERLATAFLLVLAVVSLLSGAVFAAAGTPVAIPYCVLFASILVVTAALGRSLRIGGRSGLAASVTTIVRKGAAGTRIAHSSTQFALLIALMSTCSAFCVLASIGIAVHARGTGGVPVMSVVAGIIGAFCATFVVSAALGRVRRGGLTLSVHGVEQRGWSFASHLGWSDIAGVTAAVHGHPAILVIGYANADWQRGYTTRLWRIDRLPPVPMINVDCRKFTVHRDALLDYLRHYVENPAAHGELGTDAAVARAARP